MHCRVENLQKELDSLSKRFEELMDNKDVTVKEYFAEFCKVENITFDIFTHLGVFFRIL